VTEYDTDTYSVHFARFAGRLETHLLKYGVACSDADMIIEESSVLYFEKLKSPTKKFLKVIKRQDPTKLFIESAYKSLEKRLPEAKKTFGSYNELSKCIYGSNK
jgi:PhoPQ-activated pathogenicity-related protein